MVGDWSLQGVDVWNKWRKDNSGITPDLRFVKLPIKAKLQEIDFSMAELKGAELQGANLKMTNLQGTNLQEVDLRESDLSESDLRKACLNRANLEKCYLNQPFPSEGTC